ncbi:MAG: bacteriophage holin [candidate division Zixibacteria bacterium]
MKLNVKAFALTCGIIWGLGLFFITWWVMIFEGQAGNILPIGIVYRGYCVTVAGSFIGLAWGLVDGLIGGAIFAWLYNTLAEKCGKKTEAAI